MARVLVVDDDPAIREMVALALSKSGHSVVRADGAASALAAARAERFDLVVCDIYMPGEDGVALLERMRTEQERSEQERSRVGQGEVPFILMTARGSIETVTRATRAGAFDYLAKPFDLKVLIERVTAALATPRPGTPVEEGPETMIVGSHPAIVEVYKALARVAPLPVPVLVLGETGTGKELIARALHRFGARPGGPFVAVNCSAVPDTLLESELFGHVRGAFTDAHRDRRGALTQADGGTVFLDEIGDISPAFQVKLLRFLQEGEVRPLGAEAVTRVSVRVVAATHQDLPRMVAPGRFREDLYFRLAGYEIVLPPLRARLTDLPTLVEHLRRRALLELGLADRGPASSEVLAVLAGHPWPGNVRELEQVVRRLLIDARSLTDPDAARAMLAAGAAARNEERPVRPENAVAGTLEDAERRHIAEVLAASRGNRSAAARLLGIERKTLARKIARLGIQIESTDDERDAP